MTISKSLLASTAFALVAAQAVYAQDSCSAYPTGTADKIESTAVDAQFGPVPAPKRNVTKTLMNEFWQDVAAGVKAEAGKHGIAVDVQAAKDESSMIEQLNLAQTVLAQKPDALLLSPQSDSNIVPVVQAARAANVPTIIIDHARTEGARTCIGTDQVSIGASAASFLAELYPNGAKVAQIEGAAGSPNARLRIQGFKEELAKHPTLELVASQPRRAR